MDPIDAWRSQPLGSLIIAGIIPHKNVYTYRN